MRSSAIPNQSSRRSSPVCSCLPRGVVWFAIPEGPPAMSGAAEDAALDSIPAPSDADVDRVSYLVRDALLPAIEEDDLAAFGAALTEIQQINGRWFASAQGGTFAPGASEHLVRCMMGWGIPGVGQSSWGPAVYGIVDGEDAAAELAVRLRGELGDTGVVHEGPFRRTGARVWRDSEQMMGDR
jgi:beta-ribofuranosylaminobenzene 5'-phosphate synthase